MDVPLLIRYRLEELGLEQKDLANAAQVTESYISQLLTRKKTPPAPGRTDIYSKMGAFLRLPGGELAKLAGVQRREELKKRIAEAPTPLFQECRELLLRKCEPERRPEMRRIFEKEPFGEFERLITQKLLDAAQHTIRSQMEHPGWLHRLAKLCALNHPRMRVSIVEFLNTDAFHASLENCVTFLDPLIATWDIDLRTFAVEIALNPRMARGGLKRFEFVERESQLTSPVEPGLEQFLKDPALSGDATEEEIVFLRALKLGGKRPAPLYYYRELQNLRDPIHFQHSPPAAPEQ